jgi:uncharacterized LabA/DUF88 family protein
MASYAILIDGGFLKKRLGSAAAPATAEQIREFADAVQRHPLLAEHRLHRIYYYDAPPLTDSKTRPLSDERVNFGATEIALRSTRLLQAVTRFPFFANRLGETVFRGWAVRPDRLRGQGPEVRITGADLQPVIQQKGVDMRIALDVASLTLKKLAGIIVLVTADSDFVPAMKFARREGAQLFLCPLGNPTRDSLIEHADVVLTIDGY